LTSALTGVNAFADKLSKLTHTSIYLFFRLLPVLEVGYIRPFNDEGKPVRRGLRASTTCYVKQGPGRSFGVMSISGLISEWSQNETGKFIIKDVSEGE
jgi:hypothetical protein